MKTPHSCPCERPDMTEQQIIQESRVLELKVMAVLKEYGKEKDAYCGENSLTVAVLATTGALAQLLTGSAVTRSKENVIETLERIQQGIKRAVEETYQDAKGKEKNIQGNTLN